MKKKIVAFLLALLFAAPAYGQNSGSVTNHAFAIGKGAGVAGYTSLLCSSGQLAIGSATDPVCRTVSGDATLSAAGVVALATVNANVGTFGSSSQTVTLTINGKGLITGAVAQSISAPALFPTPVRAGDVIYWNGSSWVTLAGNNSGSVFLAENASGVPSWAAGTVTGVASVGGLTGAVGITASDLAVSGSSIQLSAARRTISAGCAINATATATCSDGSAGANNGTYTTPTGALWLEVELVGGGGGGAGSGTTPGNGGPGGATTWGAGPILSSGTSIGATGATGGAGGTPSGGFVNRTGAAGGNGSGLSSTAGGVGGASPYAGAGAGGAPGGGSGANAATNSGSGGGGGGVNSTINGGGGGGSGGFLKAIINTPAATYSYAVGAGGTAGTLGTGGAPGGAGGSGYIQVIPHFN